MSTHESELLPGEVKEALFLKIVNGLEFVDTPGKYLCSNCFLVPLFHYVFECGHYYCRTCHQVFNKERRTCRKCMVRFSGEIKQDRKFELAVIGLMVRCPNRKFGCQEAVQLRQLPDHELQCVYQKECALPIRYVQRVELEDQVEELLEQVREIKRLATSAKTENDQLRAELTDQRASQEKLSLLLTTAMAKQDDLRKTTDSLRDKLDYTIRSHEEQAKPSLANAETEKRISKHQEEAILKMDKKIIELENCIQKEIQKKTARDELINVLSEQEKRLTELENEFKEKIQKLPPPEDDRDKNMSNFDIRFAEIKNEILGQLGKFALRDEFKKVIADNAKEFAELEKHVQENLEKMVQWDDHAAAMSDKDNKFSELRIQIQENSDKSVSREEFDKKMIEIEKQIKEMKLYLLTQLGNTVQTDEFEEATQTTKKQLLDMKALILETLKESVQQEDHDIAMAERDKHLEQLRTAIEKILKSMVYEKEHKASMGQLEGRLTDQLKTMATHTQLQAERADSEKQAAELRSSVLEMEMVYKDEFKYVIDKITLLTDYAGLATERDKQIGDIVASIDKILTTMVYRDELTEMNAAIEKQMEEMKIGLAKTAVPAKA